MSATTNVSKYRSRPAASRIVVAAPSTPTIVTSSARSRSPVAASSSRWPGIVIVYVPAGISIRSAPGSAFASRTAARSVHAPPAVAQIPSPGVSSRSSAVLFTTNVVPANAGMALQSAARRMTAREERMRIVVLRGGLLADEGLAGEVAADEPHVALGEL